MSSSAHIDNKKKDILVLGIGQTQGLEHTLQKKRIQLILQWQKKITMEQTVICLSMVQKFICLGNISKDWSVDNLKKLD